MFLHLSSDIISSPFEEYIFTSGMMGGKGCSIKDIVIECDKCFVLLLCKLLNFLTIGEFQVTRICIHDRNFNSLKLTYFVLLC